jgi:hypothetical protein
MRCAFLRRRARGGAPVRAGSGRAGPAARRRRAAARSPARVSPDHRPGPVRAAARRGDRLHRTIRRPLRQVRPAPQRRRYRRSHRGHPAARAHLEAAAQAAQQIGYEDAAGPMLLGCVLRAEGDSDGARSAFEAALRIGRRNGSNWHLAGAILGLALPGRGCGRLGTGSHAPRHRAGFKDRTGPASRGKKTRRVSAGTAWTKRMRTWAMSSWSGPAHGMALSRGKALDLIVPKAARASPLPPGNPRIVIDRPGQGHRRYPARVRVGHRPGVPGC